MAAATQRSSVPILSWVTCVNGLLFRNGPPLCSKICVLEKRLQEAIRQPCGHERGSIRLAALFRGPPLLSGCGGQATNWTNTRPAGRQAVAALRW